MLNYLYAMLESEAGLAAAALGLDPGLGFIHKDTPTRNSLACDLMEPIRPLVDAYVLDWITQQPLNRNDFFEQRDGNCRLIAPFAARLGETAPTWARAVAPFAESVARTLWSKNRSKPKDISPATRLTQRHKQEAKGVPYTEPTLRLPQPENLCRGCGKIIRPGSVNCFECHKDISSIQLTALAQAGRLAAHSPEAESRRAEVQRLNTTAGYAWRPSDQPSWLTEAAYTERIQPALKGVKLPAIASALKVSMPYAAKIRKGERRPHARHWLALARLVGIAGN